jgi:hypothetical protein
LANNARIMLQFIVITGIKGWLWLVLFYSPIH